VVSVQFLLSSPLSSPLSNGRSRLLVSVPNSQTPPTRNPTSRLHPPLAPSSNLDLHSTPVRNPAFSSSQISPAAAFRRTYGARSIPLTLKPSLPNQFVSPRRRPFCAPRLPVPPDSRTGDDHGVRNAHATGRRRRSQLGCFSQGSPPWIVSSSRLLAPAPRQLDVPRPRCASANSRRRFSRLRPSTAISPALLRRPLFFRLRA
jgi:hypothetical protein